MRRGVSVVMRHRRWVETTDPIERAELFGRLDGVIDALCIVESSSSIAEAMERLRRLERKYSDQYDGLIPDSTEAGSTNSAPEV